MLVLDIIGLDSPAVTGLSGMETSWEDDAGPSAVDRENQNPESQPLQRPKRKRPASSVELRNALLRRELEQGRASPSRVVTEGGISYRAM